MIYFIMCGDLVKIGTASDVRARLSSMQTGNPAQMSLLGEILGGRDVESDLHRRFGALRVRGEWFQYSGELRAFVDGVISATPRTCTDVPYGLFDSDSAFFGLFDCESDLLRRAYAQACRATSYSSVGQWWRFEGGTNPTGWSNPVEQHGRRAAEYGLKTKFCTLRDARDFKCEEGLDSLQRLLRKAQEF